MPGLFSLSVIRLVLPMLVPAGSGIHEIIIKKSRFISEITPVADPEAARAVLKAKKAEHPDAAHVVHAFICGDQRQFMGMSDDGEPSGTSGKPVIEILKGRGITNLIITVVRYFGGTKLGTGGLVRAYSEAAAGVLDKLKTSELIHYRRFELKADYQFFNLIKSLFEELETVDLEEIFGTDIRIIGNVPMDKASELESRCIDLTNGTAEIEII